MRNTPTNKKHLQIKIGGVDYSDFFVFPFVIQESGTEQLNTAMVTLANTRREAKFSPFTPVVIGGGKYEYVIANDSVTEKFGLRRWDHELTLIDATKTAERELMEAKSFTQPLVPDYADGQTFSRGIFDRWNSVSGNSLETREIFSDVYLSPVEMQGVLQILPLKKISVDLPDKLQRYSVSLWYSDKNTVSVLGQSAAEKSGLSLIKSQLYEINQGDAEDWEITKPGTYTVQYTWGYQDPNINMVYGVSVYFPIAVVEQAGERKPYSLYDVTKTLLETARPIRNRLDTSSYTIALTDEQEEMFRGTRAPELHFPNGRSLLENLSVIGDYIHAVPRISNDKKVSFKFFGETKTADLSKGSVFGRFGQFNAADYASTLDTVFANLVNVEDEAEGSVVDPYTDGFVTLRSTDARIGEGTANIKTAFPIAKIKKVLVRYHNPDGSKAKESDITKYVFEKSEYDLLSSYSGVFPFSKTTALYYTNGSKNIDGLWYRVEDEAISFLNAFKHYAITNVVNDAMGINLEQKEGVADFFPRGSREFMQRFLRLSFQVTYVPIINGRVRQERTESVENGKIAIPYNQSANKMSAKQFGENLRGKVAMMARPTNSLMYLFRDLDDVPHAFLLYDKNKYISLVTTRVFPDFCVSQIDLAENFNNLGAYLELKNGIRQYEIPQGESRHTLLEEYGVIGKKETSDSGTLCTEAMREDVVNSCKFIEITDDVSSVYLKTFDDDDNLISGAICLPVYSTSVGNSAYIGFSFEDNFAAGVRSVGYYDDENKAYRALDYVRYGDAFYSTAKYLRFDFVNKFSEKGAPLETANDLPAADTVTKDKVYITTGEYPLVWNKDSADHGSVAYQLHLVSNDGYIIGSELAKRMPFVRSSGVGGTSAMVFFYDHRLNEITGESKGGFSAGSVHSSTLSVVYDPDSGSYAWKIEYMPKVPYVSWAVKTVEDNLCILGKNTDSAEQMIYFNFRRERADG
jgi:hypothetical protein